MNVLGARHPIAEVMLSELARELENMSTCIYCRVGFNYFASQYGAGAALMVQFDAIRQYIRYTKSPVERIWTADTQPVLDDEFPSASVRGPPEGEGAQTHSPGSPRTALLGTDGHIDPRGLVQAVRHLPGRGVAHRERGALRPRTAQHARRNGSRSPGKDRLPSG